jgi:mannose/fructose/N-acetylgalactosamine-specific phosphotransferase system component IIC
MPDKSLTLPEPHPHDLQRKVGDAILNLVLQVPASTENEMAQPRVRAQAIARTAARQASLMAASLALPPGVLGWLTVLPELVAVWRLQAQMVSDIAASYGKTAVLSREHMLYCLFRHVSAQLFRDVVVRVGERFVIQRASLALVQSLAQSLGIRVTQSIVGKGISRLIPLIGAVGVGAYAYYDTSEVAKTAIELFSRDILDAQFKVDTP